MPTSTTGQGRRSSAPPASGRATILLPPWTRAPGLGFRNPAVLLAVIGAAAILACASSSAALFLSSSSSKALQNLVGAQCADAAQPTIQTAVNTPVAYTSGGNPTFAAGPVSAAGVAALDRTAATAMRGAGLQQPARRMTSTFWQQRAVPSLSISGTTPHPAAVSLYYGDGALASVQRVTAAGGRGVWVPDTITGSVGIKAGATVRVDNAPVRVAGIYRDLLNLPTPAYWCSQVALIHNLGIGDAYPPKLLIFTDPGTFAAVDHRVPDNPTFGWIAPDDTHHTSLSHARSLLRRIDTARDPVAAQVTALRIPHATTSTVGALPVLAEHTATIRTGLRGPVIPIAIAGSILALLLVGASGSYWADRRFREVRLLSSRGVGPVALAVKAAAELTLPAVIGTALGWGMAIGLVRLMGPSSVLDASAPRDAGLTAAATLVAGVLLLALVAGLRARNATERPVGHRRGWVALVPWELAVLGGSLALYLRLRSEESVRLVSGIAQINLLVVAFPLVFLVGAAMLVVRVIGIALPLIRRASTRWPTSAYFAVRRITGATVVSLTLVAAAAMPVAVLIYSGAITSTSQATVDAKAGIYSGAPVSVSTAQALRPTPELRKVGTSITRYSAVHLGDYDADVIAIDPSTFAPTASWNPKISKRSLADLVSALSHRTADGRVPALVVGARGGGASTTLSMGSTTRRLQVVARPQAFPGLRNHYNDFVVVDAALLGPVDSYVERQFEVWSRGSAQNAQRVITDQGGILLATITPTSVVQSTNYVAITWTFGYLQALAALVGMIAIGGLLLYLATRQRSRTASYAMGRRMGLSRGRHLRSLVVELSALLVGAWITGAALAWIAVLSVYGRLDVDVHHPPGPLLTVPLPALIGSAIAVVVVAVVAAAAAQHASDRADISEVLRLDA